MGFRQRDYKMASNFYSYYFTLKTDCRPSGLKSLANTFFSNSRSALKVSAYKA